MSDYPKKDNDYAGEFHKLGQNLLAAIQAAWGSSERKQFTDEMVKAVDDLGSTIRQKTEDFSASESAQKLRDEVEEVGEKLRNAEIQEKVRKDVLTALQTANMELQKVIDRWANPGGETSKMGQPTQDEKPKTEA